MDHLEIQQKAKELEEVSRTDRSALVEQLHDMKPAERSAIAKQMKIDEKSDPSLPQMEFTKGGDPKSADIKYPNGSTEHDEFDSKTGNLKSADITYNGQAHDAPSWRYDGQSVALTPGRTTELDYKLDPKAEQLKSADIPYKGQAYKDSPWHPDGTTEHDEFDAETGHEKFADIKTPHGSTDHTVYDPYTGQIRFEDRMHSNGTTEHIVVNSGTGYGVSDEIRLPDGTSEDKEYERETGRLAAKDERFPDGYTSHHIYPGDGRELLWASDKRGVIPGIVEKVVDPSKD